MSIAVANRKVREDWKIWRLVLADFNVVGKVFWTPFIAAMVGAAWVLDALFVKK